MRVLILLVFCLSVIGCGKRGERIHNIADLDQDQLNIVNNKNIMNNRFDIDIIALDLNTKSIRNIRPICRGIEGCLKVCEYFDKAKCKQLSIDKVLAFWLNQISMYSKWEQARNDLNLIATQPDVSDFLSNVDENNQVMEALFRLSVNAHCPVNEQPSLGYSYTPYANLYLRAPEPVEDEPTEDLTAVVIKELEAEKKAAQEALVGAEAELEAVKAKGEGATTQEELAAAEAKVAEAQKAVEDSEAKLVAAQEAALKVVAPAPPLAVEASTEEAGVERGAATENDADLEMQKQIPVSMKKKIMDGQVLYFNLPVFVRYIKKCFGYDSKTFSQLALEIENKKAFEMGDRVISKACSENSECIRLSYCAMDSELVWTNLKPSIKEAGCDYEGFSEMLP